MSATQAEWPRVQILPDPEEDIRFLGVPTGRWAWLGPLISVPLIFTVVGVSIGILPLLPVSVAMAVAAWALFGLDLWRPVAWWATRLARPRQFGVSVHGAPAPAAGRDGAAPAAPAPLDRLLAGVLGAQTAAGEPPSAALVDPSPLDHGDPDGLWRRWAAALRRATARGATVQAVTWIGADWDPAAWEAERRELGRAADGTLKDLAMARLDLHRSLALAVGRRTPHLVRVMPGSGTPPGTADELVRHAAQALAGAGTWRPAGGEALAEALAQWADWPGWFLADGGGTRDMLPLWAGQDGPEEDGCRPADGGMPDGTTAEEDPVPPEGPAQERQEGGRPGRPDGPDGPEGMPTPAAPDPAARRPMPAILGIVSRIRARSADAEPGQHAIPDAQIPGHGGVVVVLGRAGVGKTTATAGLAAALGRAGASVVAVDAARPQPRLGYLLGAWQTSGFREALRGSPLDWCVSGTPAPGVDLLASGVASIGGDPPPDPSAVTALVRALAARWRWVIVDTPGGMREPETVGALVVASAAVWVVDGDPLDVARVRDLWPRAPGDAVHCAVVMRADPRVGADADTLSARLDLPVIAEIPERRGEEWAAMARGGPPADPEWDRAAAALAELVGAPLRPAAVM